MKKEIKLKDMEWKEKAEVMQKVIEDLKASALPAEGDQN